MSKKRIDAVNINRNRSNNYYGTSKSRIDKVNAYRKSHPDEETIRSQNRRAMDEYNREHQEKREAELRRQQEQAEMRRQASARENYANRKTAAQQRAEMLNSASARENYARRENTKASESAQKGYADRRGEQLNTHARENASRWYGLDDNTRREYGYNPDDTSTIEPAKRAYEKRINDTALDLYHGGKKGYQNYSNLNTVDPDFVGPVRPTNTQNLASEYAWLRRQGYTDEGVNNLMREAHNNEVRAQKEARREAEIRHNDAKSRIEFMQDTDEANFFKNITPEQRKALEYVYNYRNSNMNHIDAPSKVAAMKADEGYKIYGDYYNYAKSLVDSGLNDYQINRYATTAHRNENAKKAETWDPITAEYAKEHPVINTIGSTALNVLGGVPDALETLGDLAENRAYGTKGLDMNAPGRTLTRTSRNIRDTVSNEIDSEIGKQAYSLATSTLDTLAAAGLAGITGVSAIGGASIGLSAGAETTNDLIQRGATAEQAAIGGLAAATFETLFETLSISMTNPFQTIEKMAVTTPKEFITKIVASAFTNATEEAVTEAANIVYDTLANGDISEYNVSIRNYMAQGMSEEEAKKQTAKDMVMRTLEAGAMGGIQGAFLGGLGGGASMVKSKFTGANVKANSETTRQDISAQLKDNNVNAKAVPQLTEAIMHDIEGTSTEAEKQLINNNPVAQEIRNANVTYNADVGVKQIVDRALQSENSATRKQAQRIQDKINNGIEPTDVEIGGLTDAIQQENAEIINSKRASEQEKAAARDSFIANNVMSRNMSAFRNEHNTMNAADRQEFTNPTMNVNGRELHIDGGNSGDGKFNAVYANNNGEWMVKTGDGNSMKASDAANLIVNENDRAVWQSVLETMPTPNAANVVLDAYDGQSDIQGFVRAAEILIAKGKTGADPNIFTVQDYNPNDYFTAETQNKLLIEGLESREFKAGATVLGTNEELKKSSEFQVKVLNKIARDMGFEVFLFDSMSDGAGKFYNGAQFRGTNRIALSLDAQGGLLLRAFAHEQTHFIAENNSQGYKLLEDATLKALGIKNANGEINEKKLEKTLEKYGKQGYESEDKRLEELVADSMFGVYGEGVVRNIVSEDVSLAKSIYNKLNEYVTKAKAAIKALSSNGKHPEIEAIEGDLEKLTELRDIFFRELNTATQNYKNGQQIEQKTEQQIEQQAAHQTDEEGITEIPFDESLLDFSTQDETDEEYANAINKYGKDSEQVAKIVERAAFDWGAFSDYKSETPIDFYHGTPNGGFTVFDGKKTRNGADAAGSYWFTENDKEHAGVYRSYPGGAKAAENPMTYKVWIKAGNYADIGNGRVMALDYDRDGAGAATRELKAVAKAIAFKTMYNYQVKNGKWLGMDEIDKVERQRANQITKQLTEIARNIYADFIWQVTETKEFANLCVSEGLDGVIAWEQDKGYNGTEPRMVKTYGVFNRNDIKSADPVTYDNEGNIIPLSQRFNSNNDDIRWSTQDTDENGFTQEDKIESSDIETNYSVRDEDPPKKTLIAYKAFVVKKGKLYPPMVKNPQGAATPVGVWLNADTGELARDKEGNIITTTSTGRLRVKGKSGTLAWRPGWHLGEYPDAKQFAVKNPETGKLDVMPENIVFAECEIAADNDYQLEAFSYGVNKGGAFNRTQAGLPYIPRDGYYKYRTNPNPDTAPWYITGAMKVTRILTDEECREICAKYNVTSMPRRGGDIDLEAYGLKAGEVTPTADLSNVPKGVDISDEIRNLPGYVRRELNFNSKALIKEFDIDGLDIDYYKKLYNESNADNIKYSTQEEAKESLENNGLYVADDNSVTFSTKYAFGELDENGKLIYDKDKIDELAKAMSVKTGNSVAKCRKFLKDNLSLTALVLSDRQNLEYEADDFYSPFKENSEYWWGSIDFNTNCPKRKSFTEIYDRLQEKFSNRSFDQYDLAAIRNVLQNSGIQVACGLCFVEDRRQQLGKIASEYIKMVKQAQKSKETLTKTNSKGGKTPLHITEKLAAQWGEILGVEKGQDLFITDDYVPTQYDLGTYEGFRALRENHPQIAMGYIAYNNSRGQQSGRFIEGRAEYKRQLLDLTDEQVRKMNENGGLRIFSFSDFEAPHTIDLVQIIEDCATRGIKVQAYTKQPSFARMVKDTNLKLNLSRIPSGVGYKEVSKGTDGAIKHNGKYYVLTFDNVEGISSEVDEYIDTSKSNNIGNVLVGINDTQIKLAMKSGMIDFIIPFHTNQRRAVLAIKGVSKKWDNYKNTQNERYKSNNRRAKSNVNIYTDVIQKHNISNETAKANGTTAERMFTEAFLEECAEKNLIPRFNQYLEKGDIGGYGYTEGYYKFLVDYKLFDNKGNMLEQQVVQPKFDIDYVTEMIEAQRDTAKQYDADKSKRDAAVETLSALIKTGALNENGALRNEIIKQSKAKDEVRNVLDLVANMSTQDELSDIDRYYAETIAENRAFQMIFSNLENAISSQRTSYSLSQKEVDKVVNRIMKKWGGTDEKFRDNVTGIFDYMLQVEKNGGDVTSEEIMKYLLQASKDMLLTSEQLDDEEYEETKQLRKTLREDGIYVPEEKLKALAAEFGYKNTAQLRRHFMGRILLTTDPNRRRKPRLLKHLSESEFAQKKKATVLGKTYTDYDSYDSAVNAENERRSKDNWGGRPSTLDTWWSDLSTEFPQYFDAENYNDYDQFHAVDAFLDITRPRVYQPFGEPEETFGSTNPKFRQKSLKQGELEGYIDDAALEVMTELIAEYANITRTYTDKQKMLNYVYDVHTANVEYRKKLRGETNAQRKKMAAEMIEYERNKINEYRNAREATERRRIEQNNIDRNWNYVNSRIEQKSKTKHIPHDFERLAEAFVRAIPGGDNFKAKFNRQDLNNLLVEYKAKVEDIYAGSAAEDEVKALVKDFEDIIPIISDGVRGRRAITPDELDVINQVSSNIRYLIDEANKVFIEGKKYEVQQISNRIEKEYEGQKESIFQEDTKNKKAKALSNLDRFMLGITKPEYLFKNSGSDTIYQLYKSIRKGENTEGKILNKSKAAIVEAKKNNHYDPVWSQKTISYKTTTGVELNMTVPQAMYLYALSKREQGVQHIIGDEANNIIGEGVALVDAKTGRKVKSRMTRIDVNNIIAKLSSDQIKYVDEIQKFLSNELSVDRNEVSMAIMGFEKYTEKDNYIPIVVDKSQIKQNANVNKGEPSIANQGASKTLVAGAKNAVKLIDFDEVVNNHIHDTAMYCGYATATENFNRVWNANLGDESEKIHGLVSKYKGTNYESELHNMIVAVNGGTDHVRDIPQLKGMMIRAKKAATMANLSVVVQQPTAVFRAMRFINPKYFATVASKADLDEMYQWNGCALKKSIGYFDVNVGKTINNWLSEYNPEKSVKENWSLSERWKNFKIMDTIDELASYGAEKADEITWGAIWLAAKKQIAAEQKLTGDELNKAAAELFQRTIVESQVYDSVFSKPAYMRSKGGMAQLVTAFMSEPLTSFNMMVDAVKNRKIIGTKQMLITFADVGLSIAAANACKTLVQMLRKPKDEDEEKDWLVQYLSKLSGNVVSDIFGMVPLIGNVISSLEGYSNDVLALSSIDSIVKTFNSISKVFQKEDATWEDWRKALYNGLNAISQATGIPVYNVTRDIMSIIDKAYNTITKEKPNIPFEFNDLKWSIAEELEWIPGVTAKIDYSDYVEDFLEGKDTEETQERIGDKVTSVTKAIGEKYRSGKITRAEAKRALMALADKDEKKAETYLKSQDTKMKKEAE